MKITFMVPGVPQGKARPRVVHPAVGRSMAYTPRRTTVFENMVKIKFFEAAGVQYQCPDAGLLYPGGTPVQVKIKAYFLIPTSASKKKKEAMLSGKVRPQKKPDVDNIVKIVLDALNGVAYKDDAQVVSLQIEKSWAEINCTTVEIEEMTPL